VIGMRARTFVFRMIVIATAVLGGTMAANILIDPEGVFGSKLVPAHFNPNTRYIAYRDYQAATADYDAVLFASSRGHAFDRAVLAERLGVGAVADFSVSFGLLSDHLPTLEFLLRDRAAHGGRIKAVFLVLDADFFGKQPWTNTNIDGFLPPAISGENPARFWWRYLTAYQFHFWSTDVRYALSGRLPWGPPREGSLRRAIAAAMPVAIPSTRAVERSPRLVANDVASAGGEMAASGEIRSDLERQLGLLARFVALCRERDVRLVVAFSPLNRQNVRDDQAADTEAIVDRVARVTPVWDFGRPAWLSQRPDLWVDLSHYSRVVAAMMLDRIFGQPVPAAPADFGRLREN
jgi:hypothetical protein